MEMRIKITDQIKTSKPGALQPELILPFFKDKPGLCVASAILKYINFTKELRDSNTKNLFISTTKPFTAVSAQTIGHWIKSLLGKAGLDTNQFTAYSTRHAAVSAAHKRGVDITTIRRSAGWAPNSQTFFKFYNRPIQTRNDQFARAILEHKTEV
jgi:Phage integrase family.